MTRKQGNLELSNRETGEQMKCLHVLCFQGLTSETGCVGDMAANLLCPFSPRLLNIKEHTQAPYHQELTSSFVVWLELIRYVWKPESPTIDQTEKKHTTASSTVTWSQGSELGGREKLRVPRSRRTCD